MSIPFKIGQRWRLKSNHSIQGTIRQTLFSRARRNYEAWARMDERYPGLWFPFPGDDVPGRRNDFLINVEEWEPA